MSKGVVFYNIEIHFRAVRGNKAANLFALNLLNTLIFGTEFKLVPRGYADRVLVQKISPFLFVEKFLDQTFDEISLGLGFDDQVARGIPG